MPSYQTQNVSPEILALKPNGKWSIKENIGHLLDLEPLWQGRFDDVLNKKEFLREADLENKKTDRALHNQVELAELLSNFKKTRLQTIDKLNALTEKSIYQTALHPRLLQPMRIMDLFLFVAEHDDHHLAQINNLTQNHSS